MVCHFFFFFSFFFFNEVRDAASNYAYYGYPKLWILRYPAHRYHAVPSPGFEPTTLWLRVRRPNHSAREPASRKFRSSLISCLTFYSSSNNEEPACRKTRQTSLQSIIPKDVMTSLLSLLTSNRRKICLSKKLMRYRELCIDAQNPSRISLAVCYFEIRTTLENGEFGMIDASAA
jgi:hypothetical protein